LLRSRFGAGSSAEQVTPSLTHNTPLNSPDAGAYLTAPVAPTNAAHQSTPAAPDIGAAHRSLPNAGDLQMTSPISSIALGVDIEQDEIKSPVSPSALGIHMGQEEMEQPVEAAQRDSDEVYLPRAASEGSVGLGPSKPLPPIPPPPPPGTPSGRRGCTSVAAARARGAGGGVRIMALAVDCRPCARRAARRHPRSCT